MLIFVKNISSCFLQSCLHSSFQASSIDFQCYVEPSNWLVEMEEDKAYDHLSFSVNINFYYSISFYHFGQEEGQKILSWSPIQTQFISAFHLTDLHLPTGLRVGRTNFFTSFLGQLSPLASLRVAGTGNNICFASLRSLYLSIWLVLFIKKKIEE